MKQTALFPENNPAWLAQFKCSTLLVNLFNLCGSAPVYIVDKDQQVLYWSLAWRNYQDYGNRMLLARRKDSFVD